MATKAILTSRELKNKVTGIDIMVPDYEEVSGKMSKSAIYHVIVITRLFYYKSSKHKESDVVQFMIPKRYEEFEDLYQKLSTRFPSVLFPDLPRKSMITNTSVIQERKKVMDTVMHMVAKTQKLCCSPMILEFLGVRKPQQASNQVLVVSDSLFEEKSPKQDEPHSEAENSQQEKKEAEKTKNTDEEDLFVPVDLNSSASLETDEQDAFTSTKTRKLELHASLFEDEVEKTGQQDDSLLFAPVDLKSQLLEEKDNTETENVDDLLQTDDDIDELMALSKKSERKASIKATSSNRPVTKPKPQTRTSFETVPDDDDMSMLSSTRSDKTIKTDPADVDLFKEARKMSLRDKREKQAKSDTLDDIFEKNSGTKNPFSKNNNDDDLFASNTAAANAEDASSLEQDDILKYIDDNSNQQTSDLDL